MFARNPADPIIQEERDREQWEEFEQTWAKRRRLIREKSELDNPPKPREYQQSAVFAVSQ